MDVAKCLRAMIFNFMRSLSKGLKGCYGSDLKYFACVLKETTEVLTVKFLERKADGCYEIKKAEEEVEKILVFERYVPVTWVGPGRYIVQDLRSIGK